MGPPSYKVSDDADITVVCSRTERWWPTSPFGGRWTKPPSSRSPISRRLGLNGRRVDMPGLRFGRFSNPLVTGGDTDAISRTYLCAGACRFRDSQTDLRGTRRLAGNQVADRALAGRTARPTLAHRSEHRAQACVASGTAVRHFSPMFSYSPCHIKSANPFASARDPINFLSAWSALPGSVHRNHGSGLTVHCPRSPSRRTTGTNEWNYRP